MGKNSKKRDAERKKLRQDWGLNQLNKIVPDKLTSPIIPPEVAISNKIPEIEEHCKTDNLRLIFASYNHNQCELHKLHYKKIKALIRLFNRITCCNLTKLPNAGIIRDNVNKSGEYVSLFNGLSPDVDLKEASFGNTERLFFYTYQSFFCIVAIKATHFKKS